MKVCVVGATGYSGQELVRLLAGHPLVDLVAVTSRTYAGKPVAERLPALRGVMGDMTFSSSSPEAVAELEAEVFFLALPHGAAAAYAVRLVEAGKRVIDLSADFRLGSPELYQQYYGQEHPAPDLLRQAVYGLPELKDLSWSQGPLIASPGCYPTSILLPLFPLLEADLVEPEGIVANSMSGVSGAGRQSAERFSYCERNESAVAYGLPQHRHLSEIEEQLALAAGSEVVISFHPHLAPMNRGIASTISVVAKGKPDAGAVEECWSRRYEGRPFAHSLPSGEFPDVAHVVGSNRVEFSVTADHRTGRYVLTSAEDNLIKGAGGQAIQSMNLCSGFDESAGLV
ncbi:MAG: N-acetyl-gamma-glutamyl-phosphate reductase [Opitutales bacterium]|jgi:N-acetyl-gamma-glutamyl-phosphate reductase